jgi:hypothetical protein
MNEENSAGLLTTLSIKMIAGRHDKNITSLDQSFAKFCEATTMDASCLPFGNSLEE